MSEQVKSPAQEQDVSQLLAIRREKLAALQQRGQDPFQITRYDVSHHSADVKEQYEALEGCAGFERHDPVLCCPGCHRGRSICRF